jgi:guanylate kinase
MWNRNLLFVISGPSGSGKTTLIKALLKDRDLKNRLKRSISFTTRPKRKNERDKKDYFFISQEEFKKKLKAKKILEWTKFLDYYYGTSLDYFKDLLKKKKHILLCLDEKGAFKLKRLYPQRTVTIFVLPPDIYTLKERIYKREGKKEEAQLQARINLAKAQLKQAKFYDYRLVNDNFKQTLKALKEIILKEIELHNYG